MVSRHVNPFRAGNWFTLRQSHTMQTTSGTRMQLHAGDMIQYKGCRTVSDAGGWQFRRYFEFDGVEIYSTSWKLEEILVPN
jgi:hypothetical protein